jgi:hypothetical protein
MEMERIKMSNIEKRHLEPKGIEAFKIGYCRHCRNNKNCQKHEGVMFNCIDFEKLRALKHLAHNIERLTDHLINK